MIETLQFWLKRAWWRRFHPFVRVGWIITRSNSSSESIQAGLGFGLIAVGLLMRRRQATRIYRTTVPTGEEVRIRVVRRGRVIASN